MGWESTMTKILPTAETSISDPAETTERQPDARNLSRKADARRSRRAIAKRVVRLAYAAPLVIATMNIVNDDADAQVVGITRP
jgi:hypothetical protein